MKTNAAFGRCTWGIALVPRTAALFIILFQICLAAGDLADVPFFAVSLLGALGSALFLFFRNRRPVEALVIIGLAPWAARLLIVIPRWYAGANAWVLLDSLLLNLDRNYFTVLVPFYWTAVTTFFSLKNRVFLRAEIISADILFIVFFSVVPAASIEAYRWPVLPIALFGAGFFLQILSFILSLPPELEIRRFEKIKAASLALVLVILGSLFFIRPSQERAVEQGGGLLEPNLFSFDFSQFLKLESEISVNNDLVFIVKKESARDKILLRRYTLSGYTAGQGFFRHEIHDEKAHPQELPDHHVVLPERDNISLYQEIDQEYYLVNFDSSAFIGMNMPVEITPFETWDASSFRSVYKVLSYSSNAYGMELYDAAGSVISSETLGMSPEDYRFYTEYGGDQDYAVLAREIIGSRGSRAIVNYQEMAELVYAWLKFGEYRYSLKPGIAPDGDQLKYFLFESKKGYCSYYAFAFALMLRSLGIPCRVAAGFFIDEETSAFGYYPVRANMAHAWVEIWYPGYGWIEYDPTSGELAPGEELSFSFGEESGQFESLLKEILDNHSRLMVREGSGDPENSVTRFSGEAVRFFSDFGPLLSAVFLAVVFLFCRAGLLWFSVVVKQPGKKARFLWAHVLRRLKLGGLRKTVYQGEAEWAGVSGIDCHYCLYLDSAAARFGAIFPKEAWLLMREHYRIFDTALRKTIPWFRRFLSWVLPPLVLALPGPKNSGKPKSRGPKTAGFSILLIILSFFVFLAPGDAQNIPPAEEIFIEAEMAEEAENWERAVELYSLGSRLYPGNFEFPWSLGDLFYRRGLYHLAWDEYLRSEAIMPMDPGVLSQLARTAAFLNLNEESAEYFERYLVIVPDDREAIGSLGWIYFKIHRLVQGERLLVQAIQRLGGSPDFSMTLGTIYSDLFNYDEAKYWYLNAIAGAKAAGDSEFAAVAHYNLSILESRFYQYNRAYQETLLSLDEVNRASGRIARGELFIRAMDLSSALPEYQAAYEMDTSPLSKLNLADLFQIGGRLEEVRLYAEDCLKPGDQYWMSNYGIDPDRYKMDIHEILMNTYEGLKNAEQFSTPRTLAETLLRPFRVLAYRFKAAVHGHLYRKYCLRAAQSYGRGNFDEIHLDSLLQFSNAFEPYPRRALNYLRQARSVEEPLIPLSGPFYDYEEGKFRKNQGLLNRAVEGFDQRWEQDMIAMAYTELARIHGSRKAAEELYSINPGALLQQGILLDVNLEIQDMPLAREQILRRAVKDAGIKAARRPVDGSSPEAPRYTLVLSGEGEVVCELRDSDQAILRQSISFPADSGKSLGYNSAVFSRNLAGFVFNGF